MNNLHIKIYESINTEIISINQDVDHIVTAPYCNKEGILIDPDEKEYLNIQPLN